MADDEYEPKRVLGMPWTQEPRARQDEEPQRVMGFPAGWSGAVDLGGLRSLAHPVRGYRRWLRHRRLGPYAIDEDEPGPLRSVDLRIAPRGTAGQVGGDEGRRGAWPARAAHSLDWISAGS